MTNKESLYKEHSIVDRNDCSSRVKLSSSNVPVRSLVREHRVKLIVIIVRYPTGVFHLIA